MQIIVCIGIGIIIGVLFTWYLHARFMRNHVLVKKITLEDVKWFDIDAQYFALDDPERTPLNVVKFNRGSVVFESENGSHIVSIGIQDAHECMSLLKPNKI